MRSDVRVVPGPPSSSLARRPPKGAIAQLGERVLCKHEVVGSIPSGSTMGPMVLRHAFDPVWLHHGAWRHWLVRKVKEICGAVRENPAGTGTRMSCSFVSGMRVFEIVKREWIRCGSYLKLPSSRRPRRPLEPDPFGKQNRPLARAEGRSF